MISITSSGSEKRGQEGFATLRVSAKSGGIYIYQCQRSADLPDQRCTRQLCGLTRPASQHQEPELTGTRRLRTEASA